MFLWKESIHCSIFLPYLRFWTAITSLFLKSSLFRLMDFLCLSLMTSTTLFFWHALHCYFLRRSLSKTITLFLAFFFEINSCFLSWVLKVSFNLFKHLLCFSFSLKCLSFLAVRLARNSPCFSFSLNCLSCLAIHFFCFSFSLKSFSFLAVRLARSSPCVFFLWTVHLV